MQSIGLLININLTSSPALIPIMRLFSASPLDVDAQTANAALLLAQVLIILSLIFVVIRNQRLRKHLFTINRDLQNILATMNDALLTLTIHYSKEGIPKAFVVHYLNAMAEEVLELPASSLLSKNLSDVIELEPELLDALHVVSVSKETSRFVHYLNHIQKYVQITIFSPDNDTLGLMIEDINLRFKTQNALKLEQERFKSTLYSVGDGVVSCDNEGNIELMNRMAEKLLGVNQKDAMGQRFDDLIVLYRGKTTKKVPSPIRTVFSSLESFELGKNTYLRKTEQHYIPIEGSFFPIIDDLGHLRGVVWVFRDVTIEREHEARIEYLSYHDQLTNLYNRHYYEETLPKIDQEQNLPISVIMCDVNGLKLTNDVFGHTEGDKLLVDVAQIITQSIPSQAIAARTGGDEFIILCPKTSLTEANAIIHRIYDTTQNLNRSPVGISISMGAEIKEKHLHSLKYIIKKAEEKMYKNKLMDSQKFQKETVEAFIKDLKPNEETIAHYTPFFQKIKDVFLLNDHQVSRLEEAFYLRVLTRPNGNALTYYNRSPEVAYRILNTLTNTTDISDILLNLYERVDGEGYPRGITQDDIPYLSRLLALVDAYFDETIEDKAAHFITHKGTRFDARLTDIFIHQIC